MWDKPPIQPPSEPAATTASSVVPEPGNPGPSRLFAGKPLITVPQHEVQASVGRKLSQSSTSAYDYAEQQRKKASRMTAVASARKEANEYEMAIRQFDLDNQCYSLFLSQPKIKLPKSPEPEDYLTWENIRRILNKKEFAERIGDTNRDNLARFILIEFPPGKARTALFMDKARVLLKVDASSKKVKQSLEKLRKDVRSSASIQAGKSYRRAVLQVCQQLRATVQQLEQRVTTPAATHSQPSAQEQSQIQKREGFKESSSLLMAPDIQEPVVEEIEPMEATGSNESTVQELLNKDSTRLYPLLEKSKGYYLVDSLPYSQFSVPQSIRDKIITPELKERFSIRAHWGITQFFELEAATSQELFGILMKQAKFGPDASDEQPVGIALSDTSNEELAAALPMTWQPPSEAANKAPEWQLKLHNVPESTKNKTLALYNRHQISSIHIFSGKQKTHVLKPGHGLVLQPAYGKKRKTGEWKPVAEYRQGKIQEEETNPLIRDLPRPVSKKSSHWDREGEYFLPAEVVRDLASQKSKPGKAPAICQSTDNIHQVLRQTFGRSGQIPGATSFIFFDPLVNHMVAARVLREGDRALVYIHETGDPGGEGVAVPIREKILNAARPFFQNYDLSFVTPGFTSQKDFSNCGVFTYKAIRAFDKHPELDQWLWQQGIQPARMLHAANGYNHRVKLAELPLEDCFVDLEDMNARLLKNYQGDEMLLSPAQRAEVVSDKKQQTLAQYLMAHQPHLALQEGHKANLSATGKRYKYMLRWQEQFMNKPAPSDPQLVQQMLPGKALLTHQEYDLITRFHPILDVDERDIANQWLAVHMPGAKPVEESDWEISCMFESFVFGQSDLSLKEAKALESWLENNLRHSDDEHHQLLQAWCIYIRQSQKSQCQNQSLEQILAQLQSHIAGGSKSFKRVMKRKRPAGEPASLPKPKKPEKQALVTFTNTLSETGQKIVPATGIKRKVPGWQASDVPLPETKQGWHWKDQPETEAEEIKLKHSHSVRIRREYEVSRLKGLAELLADEPKTWQSILQSARAEIMRLQDQEKLLEELRQKNAELTQKLAELKNKFR